MNMPTDSEAAVVPPTATVESMPLEIKPAVRTNPGIVPRQVTAPGKEHVTVDGRAHLYPNGLRIALDEEMFSGSAEREQRAMEVAEVRPPRPELNIIQTKNMSNSELGETVAYYKSLLPEGRGETIMSSRNDGESEQQYRDRLLRHLRLVYAYQYYLGEGYE